MTKTLEGYKLFRLRKNGTLGPLFINRRQVVPLGKWLDAEDHPTKGFAHRPGWHAGREKNAPHLSEKDRVWCKVLLQEVESFIRPTSQGGEWLLARRMRVVEICDEAR